MRKALALGLIACMLSTSCLAFENRTESAVLSPKQQTSEGSDSEGMQAMLHTLSLYILAAEVLAYFEDGAGDAAAMTKAFRHHPGWIPAFAQATFREDNGCLYVPLGQYLWRIGRDDHGEMKFALLFPRDAMRATAKSQARNNSKFDHSL